MNIDCIKSDSGVWCKDKRIKRSLFGLGARMCRVAQGKECEYQDAYPLPAPPRGCSGSTEQKVTKCIDNGFVKFMNEYTGSCQCIHSLRAAYIYGKVPEQITKDEREFCKCYNFGMPYAALQKVTNKSEG